MDQPTSAILLTYSICTVGGPREDGVFTADEVRAASATCDGLCPGLNTVIREIVVSLQRQYGVADGHIFGVVRLASETIGLHTGY